MLRALQLTLVWLLLIAVPVGSGPLVATAAAQACASWCPCDEAEDVDAPHEDDSPGDDDCDDDCDDCCHARVAMAIGCEQPSSTPMHAEPTRSPPLLDSPGCRLATGVFRPPRSLT